MIQVACVLKTGGVYSAKYVKRLEEAVRENTTVDYKFVCFTDSSSVDCCETIRLRHGWPGWWSKIELFRDDLEPCQTLYLDLDTMILGNIDGLLRVADEACYFTALRGFNTRYGRSNKNFASGIMAGDFSFHSNVYTRFLENPEAHMKEVRLNWRHGDQGFIASVIETCIPKLQNELPTKDYIVGKRTALAENFKHGN